MTKKIKQRKKSWLNKKLKEKNNFNYKKKELLLMHKTF